MGGREHQRPTQAAAGMKGSAGGREGARSEDGGGALAELTASVLAGTRIMGEERRAVAERP